MAPSANQAVAKRGRKLDRLHENVGGAGKIAARGVVERPFVAPVGDQVAGGDKERAGIGHRRCSRAAAEMTIYDFAMRPEDILVPTPAGVCCKLGGFHIDPTRPVERALITHAHSDHARAGHGAVLATQETLDLMRLRYGENFAGTTQAARYGESVESRRREGDVPSRRPRARLGADRGRGRWPARRRLRRLQERRRSDLRAVRAGAVRRVHHRGDVRAAGVPPWRSRTARSQSCCTRSRCFPSARIWSAPIRSARRSA